MNVLVVPTNRPERLEMGARLAANGDGNEYVGHWGRAILEWCKLFEPGQGGGWPWQGLYTENGEDGARLTWV